MSCIKTTYMYQAKIKCKHIYDLISGPPQSMHVGFNSSWELMFVLFVNVPTLNKTFDLIWCRYHFPPLISWWSLLLMEETGGPGENHRPVVSLWQTLSHNVVHLALIFDMFTNTLFLTCTCIIKLLIWFDVGITFRGELIFAGLNTIP
jgi:hypothetical protein